MDKEEYEKVRAEFDERFKQLEAQLQQKTDALDEEINQFYWLCVNQAKGISGNVQQVEEALKILNDRLQVLGRVLGQRGVLKG